MIDTESLKKIIIDKATAGLLSSKLSGDGDVNEIIAKLPSVSNKRKKLLEQSFEHGKEYDIPSHWKWIRLGEISSYGDTPTKVMPSDMKETMWILELEDIESGGRLLTKKRYPDRKPAGEKTAFKKGQILYSKLRPYLKKVLIADEDGISTPELIAFDVFADINVKYISYYLVNSYVDKIINQRSYGVKMPRVDAGFMANLPVPLPPLEEQQRIVDLVEQSMIEIDTIATLQQQYESDLFVLKGKIIDAGIRGKLTEQLPEDGDAETLYSQIQEEKAKLIKEGKIKKEKPLPEIEADEIPFEIPKNWRWVRFGMMAQIERGGSPRPIKSYITNDENGINWIKIGDVEKDGKYIIMTKEKIIPEGEKKSRHVYPGDFLLTNSMSFGRPYISKIEGCIHDGWLLIRNLYNVLDLDYLYLMLSSNYAYNQFVQKASGATVDNLNIDKVAAALIPLPPLREQKRMAKTIDELLQIIG